MTRPNKTLLPLIIVGALVAALTVYLIGHGRFGGNGTGADSDFIVQGKVTAVTAASLTLEGKTFTIDNANGDAAKWFSDKSHRTIFNAGPEDKANASWGNVEIKGVADAESLKGKTVKITGRVIIKAATNKIRSETRPVAGEITLVTPGKS